MFFRGKLKGIACLGMATAMVLTSGSNIVLSTTMGTEAPLAGMTQTLDEYCENKENGTAVNVLPESADAVSGSAVEVEKESDKESKKKTKKKESKYKNTGISTADDYVNIRKKPSTSSAIVGKLYRGSAVTIKKKKGSWVKISSGKVNGYIKKEFLAMGNKAEKLAKKNEAKYAKIKTESLMVRAKKSKSSTILTKVKEGQSYLVKSESKNWVKIKLNDGSTGYVHNDYVKVYTKIKKAVSIEQEQAEARRRAQAIAAAQNQSQTVNRSSNRSSSSKKKSSNPETVSGNGNGSAVANYALQFVGNPYRYGGTSLTNGADCSGFTMSVFRKFGISLPHGSGSQAGCGRKISLSQAKAGDLVFYASGGRISHVALYLGGGRIVHAKGTGYGIVTDSVHYNRVYCVRRVL